MGTGSWFWRPADFLSTFCFLPASYNIKMKVCLIKVMVKLANKGSCYNTKHEG